MLREIVSSVFEPVNVGYEFFFSVFETVLVVLKDAPNKCTSTERAIWGPHKMYILRGAPLDEERERRINADARRTFPYVSGRVDAPDKVIR